MTHSKTEATIEPNSRVDEAGGSDEARRSPYL